jgi:hypothetical protein
MSRSNEELDMEIVVPANFGAHNEGVAAINRANREFYDEQDQKFRRLLSDPRKAEAAYSEVSSGRQSHALPASKEISLELLRRTPTYEQQLSKIDRLSKLFIAPKLRASKDQSNRARYQRNKVGDNQTPIQQLITELALDTGYRELSAGCLAPHFFSRLREEQCNPREIRSKTGDRRKDRIDFDFFRPRRAKQRKSITIGAFENSISRIRLASRQAG